MSQLLDKHYVPVSDEERELFGRYNDYMYAVLLEKVKITKGAQIVRRHDDTGNFNAQLAIQEIRDHYMGVASKVAAMTKEQSLTELSTSRLSLQDTGTTLGEQINKFHELVLTINNLSDADSQLSPGQQLTFFKTFIENVPDMKAAAVFINMGMNAGSVANPEEAMELYEDRARSIDEDRKKLLSSRRGHRQLQAMMHDGELTHEQLAYMCDAYDVNMSEAFVMRRMFRPIMVMFEEQYPQIDLDRHLKEDGKFGIRFLPKTRTFLLALALPQLRPQRVAEDPKEADHRTEDDVLRHEHHKARPKYLPKRQRLTWGSRLTMTLMRQRTTRTKPFR